jgi:molybdopterin-guanine dinucleotide biosynthesis protein A
MIKSKRMIGVGRVARMGEEKCILRFGGKARREETTRRYTSKCEDSIKIDLR